MRKIIEVVNTDTHKIIFKSNETNFKDTESALLCIANSGLEFSDNLEIRITTIREDFNIGDYCYYKNIVCKINAIDLDDNDARVTLYKRPLSTTWVNLQDLVKIDNEDLEEATND